MAETHKHFWNPRFVTIDGVDCISGMSCECGQTIDQYQVEDIINKTTWMIIEGNIIVEDHQMSRPFSRPFLSEE